MEGSATHIVFTRCWLNGLLYFLTSSLTSIKNVVSFFVAALSLSPAFLRPPCSSAPCLAYLGWSGIAFIHTIFLRRGSVIFFNPIFFDYTVPFAHGLSRYRVIVRKRFLLGRTTFCQFDFWEFEYLIFTFIRPYGAVITRYTFAV